MRNEDIQNEYFEWLIRFICQERRFRRLSYRKLLAFMHNIEFRYMVPMDVNRADDGIELRFRFAEETHIKDAPLYLGGPCSVLEMIIALSIRCEDHIMGDPDIGDRTGKWFWVMIENLGLDHMIDERFNKDVANNKISIFLDRQYDRDGKGGLFTVPNCRYDLRTIEIWYQMCWYLDHILEG